MSNISLIIGLGNPGKEYAQTRHNAGFWFVEQLAERYAIQLKADPKFMALAVVVKLKVTIPAYYSRPRL